MGQCNKRDRLPDRWIPGREENRALYLKDLGLLRVSISVWSYTPSLKFGILQGLSEAELNWSDLALRILMLERCGMCDDWLVFLNLPRLPMTRFFVWIWFRKEDDMIWSGYKVLFGLPLGFLFFIGPRRLGLVGMLLGLVWLVFVMWPMDFTLLPRRATLVAVQGGGRWATLNYPPWMFWMQLQLETDLGFWFWFW